MIHRAQNDNYLVDFAVVAQCSLTTLDRDERRFDVVDEVSVDEELAFSLLDVLMQVADVVVVVVGEVVVE